ncbi:hypothetical protein B0T26DRAFT_867495 [Lasiosphaeria miniovina]|uniref:Clr5 domain-containing protein n=1 Tax=Lasiosphaeria miniovina TaxID=1954250 RepID=A0AA40BHN5_9PEZI|nr:uncharacterized protein B0T26DRAFT_867495 [Lasiosphaeria miniovina]KAK0734416.1 hypothetical protein B0T26DRAFT_867495 [Lasiosphaeria miniovina]
MDQFTGTDWAGHWFEPPPIWGGADHGALTVSLLWPLHGDDAMLVGDAAPFAQPQTHAPPLPASEPAPTAPSPKPPPSLEEWNRHRFRIKRLYLDQDEPLRKVIVAMGEEFGFHATASMYKKRFKQWSFVKNNRERDVRSMMALKKQRQEEGKTTQFLNNGRPVVNKRIEAYLQRKKLNPATFAKDAAASGSEALACYISCRTPSPAASFSPDFYRHSELLLRATRDSALAQFGSDNMTTKRMEELRLAGVPPTLAPTAMTCRRMLNSKDFQSAGRVLRKLGIELESSVRDGALELVQDLLRLTVILGSGWLKATKSLVKQAACLSREYGRSATQPLGHFLAQLHECEIDCLVPTAISALLCHIHETSLIFGKDSYFAVRSWTSTATYLGSSGNLAYTSLIQNAERGVRQYEARFGECDWKTLDFLDDVAELEYEEAFVLETSMDKPRRRFELLLKRAEQGGDQAFWHRFYGQYSLAWIHHSQGADEVAEQYMRGAVETLRNNDVTDIDSFVDSCVVLEQWLLDSGQHESARDVREMWTAALPPDEEAAVDGAPLVVAQLVGQAAEAAISAAEDAVVGQAAGRAGARRRVNPAW